MDFAHPLRVVSPTLDGDVLVVLAGAEEEFSGRRIHRLVGHGSEPGVRKAVERLVDQGIVLRRQAGQANLYRLNRQHVSAEAIELLAEARSQLIAWLQEAIGSWEVTPRSAALFGSAARAQAGPDSDLDLLIVRLSRVSEEDDTWQSQLGSLQRSATAWTGNDARIVELGEEELAQAGPLLTEVVRDGLALFGSLDVLRDAIKANRR
ncbi:MAG TPA: nucleotidyltransferase domain-containing protein [Solirubrobacterales bacterium]